jgi:hypothetical protein
MNCEQAQRECLNLDQAQGLDGAVGELKAHLEGCAQCRAYLRLNDHLWALPTPEPSPDLEARFMARLRIESPQKPRPVRVSWGWRVSGLAAALLLVIGGAALDRALRSEAPRAEEGDARMQGTLRLVHSPLSADRMKGLALLDAGDRSVQETLFSLVERDPDTQVRLAAVEALYLFEGDPRLRSQLGAALGRQDRPEVQVALVDLVVSLRERRALDAMRRLEREGKLSGGQRSRVQAAIAQLDQRPM